MHERDRWHMSPLHGVPGWRVWYHDNDDIYRLRYIIKPSGLMEKFCKDNNIHPDDNMLGVYAARRYEGHEIISVYVGTAIGHHDGSVRIITRVIVTCRKLFDRVGGVILWP